MLQSDSYKTICSDHEESNINVKHIVSFNFRLS